jgi:23S rRNA pseudouridine2605 synthase
MSQERLQKLLARAGIASRRAAEALISAGRVKVDGRTVRQLGTQADPEQQRIEVDGRRVGSEPLVYLVLHKPREVVSTLNDPAKRHTVMELVAGAGARVVPVGRLDYHTSGVLLFSNDGQFSRTLLHPSSGVPRQYVLKVKGPIDDARLERLRDRIVIDGRRTQPAEVVRERNEGDKVWILITLREGRNRHVRRLAEHAGFQVMRLARLTFANITAEGLAPGQWRALTRDELKELKRLYGVPKELPEGGGSQQERVEGSPVRMRTRVAQAERALRSAEDEADEDTSGARRPEAARRRAGADAGESPRSKSARGVDGPVRGTAVAAAQRRGLGADTGEQPWSRPARGAERPARGAERPQRGATKPYAKKRRPGLASGTGEQPRGKRARGGDEPLRGAARSYAKKPRAGADADARSNERAPTAFRGKKRRAKAPARGSAYARPRGR